jgi:hypothetical protein
VFQSRAIRRFNPEESVGFMAKKFIPNPTYEEIAPWAYWIYESRGRKPGSELEDWFEAEGQLIADRQHEAGLTNGRIYNERRAPWENAQPAGTITTNRSKS